MAPDGVGPFVHHHRPVRRVTREGLFTVFLVVVAHYEQTVSVGFIQEGQHDILIREARDVCQCGERAFFFSGASSPRPCVSSQWGPSPQPHSHTDLKCPPRRVFLIHLPAHYLQKGIPWATPVLAQITSVFCHFPRPGRFLVAPKFHYQEEECKIRVGDQNWIMID